ncbi:MAG: hypothetical protein PHI53_02695 [Candidatus Pacebacteria bacterium]|nr:hypothetical protein [Candidatus Paceibacterota bacterium]
MGTLFAFVCNISMRDRSVNVFSSTDAFLPLIEKGEYIPFIPGWKCSTKKVNTKYSIFYFPGKEIKLIYSKDKCSIKLYGPLNYFIDGQAIAYLIYSLLELDRQEYNQTTAHLAACSKNGRAVILLGERGAGKTSILLMLCRDYGYKLIANDIALIGFNKQRGKSFIVDGTKIFGLRHTAAEKNHPDLLKLFPKTIKDSWTTKLFISPYEINVQIENKKVVVSSVFFCHLDSGIRKIFLDRMSGSWIKINLYENFSRYIRGSALIPFLDGKNYSNIGYIPNLDTIEFHQKRINLINYLVNKLGITYISGSDIHKICDIIHKKHRKVAKIFKILNRERI